MAKIELKYKTKDYDDSVTSVNIEFISQRMLKTFGEIFSTISLIQALKIKLDNAEKERSKIERQNKDNPNALKMELERFDKDIKDANEEFMRACMSGVQDRRMELILDILKANKHIDLEGDDQPKLYSVDWWEDYVDPADAIDFVARAVQKDKKKVSQ